MEKTEKTGAGSLEGLQVIDLSRVLAGPLCTQMLADHGATVIKVEPPAGDETRTWGPPFLDGDTSGYYSALNRNKDNICLDLTSPEGVEALTTLLQGADVLVENFKAGTLARWGFTDDRLEREFPRLVHCRITGYGTEGPMGSTPGYDAALQAYSGLMSINGEPDGAPLRIGVPVVDMVTGMLSFSGILLALLERHRSGRGQRVDSTLLDSAVSLLHPHSSSWFVDGREPVRTGSAHPTIAPYDVFSAGGRAMFIGAGNDRQFRDLTTLLGRPELADDPDFVTNARRVGNRERLRRFLEDALADFDRDALSDLLLSRGIPAAPVNTVNEALDSQQVAFREMVVREDDYTGPGVPVKLSRTPGAFRTPPRRKGEDTERVLAENGCSAALMQRIVRNNG
ncbi:CaiB/BaiF CoA transferase family protein [Corynebacterium sp. AOP40-9SA-29]|uniref:CaiB/BaiF CoA transferase family protein n=1 Tax=Corynebacterium sp. AOP40-9SA-29 TaxID=3457677 RepID=UPI004034E57D